MEGEVKLYSSIKGGDNILPDTTLRACEGVLLFSARASDLGNDEPIRQTLARLGLFHYSLEKLVNRLTHGDWGEFASVVCSGSDTAELKAALRTDREGYG
jgi:hypothetical protein